MNQTYRSVWNERLGAWVAVPETSHARGKPGNVRRSVRRREKALFPGTVLGAVAFAVLALECPSDAQAVVLTPSTACTGTFASNTTYRTATSNADNATATTGSYGIAAGCSANGTGVAYTVYGAYANTGVFSGATAIGFLSKVNANFGTALGTESLASGLASTALGTGTVASGNNSVSIGGGGSSTLSVANSTTASGAGAVAIGVNTTKGAQAAAADSIALGGQSSVSSTATSGIAVGRGSSALGAYGVAMGDGITSGATGQNVAIGSSGTIANSSSSTGGAVAIGRAQKATGDGAVAIGDPNTATGTGAVALGAENVAAGDATGATAADGAVAVGNHNSAIGQGSVALGNQSSATVAGAVAMGASANATASNAVAVGSGASAAQSGAVALGAASVTATAVGTSSATIGGKSYSFAGTAPGSTVSVGVPGSERTVTNLAAGRISSTSTDAVNGSQLHATNQAVDAATTTANKGWNLSANGEASPQNVAPGGTANFADGSNIKVTRSGSTVSIATAKDVAFDSMTSGTTVVDSSGVAVGANLSLGSTGLSIASGPSVTTSGISAGSKAITNVTAGVSSTDAVNVGQLTTTNQAVAAAATTANKGWNLAVNGEASPQNIAPGGTANFVEGDNIELSRSGNTVSIATAKDAAFDSVTTGSTVVDNSGVKVGASVSLASTGLSIVGGPSLTTSGINAGSKTITNVAAGVNATDAVNVSQLEAAGNSAGGKWIAGSPSSYVAPSVAGADSTAVGSGAVAGAAGSLAVGIGANASVVNSVALGNGSTTSAAVAVTGGAIYGDPYSYAGSSPAGVVSVGTVGSERQIQNVAAGRVSATSTDAINGSQLHATHLAVEAAATTANKGWNLSANGEASPQNIGPGGTANFAGGDNIEVTRSGGTISIGTAKNVTFEGVTTGGTVINDLGVVVGPDVSLGSTGLSIAGGPSVTTSGINAGSKTITNVAAGVNATDAVNVSQLEAAGNSAGGKWIAGSPSSYVAPSVAGADSTAVGSGAVAGAAGSLAVGIGANASVVNSVALGNGSTTSAAVAVTGGAIYGDPYSYAGSSPAGVVSVGTVGSERQIQNVAAGRVSATSTDAINGSQLHATHLAVEAAATTANKGWNLSANGEASPQNIGPGDTANFAGGDNVEVTRSGSTVSIATAKDVAFDSVTAGSTVLNGSGVTVGSNVSLGSTGLVISGGPSVTSSGIDAGNAVVANVAAGVNSTDAVNFGQLSATNKAVSDAATTAAQGWSLSANGEATPRNIGPGDTANFAGGNNVEVTRSGNTISIATAKDVAFDSVTADSTVLNGSGVTAGSTVLRSSGVSVGSNVSLGSTGLVISGGPSVTSGGIDAGSQVITNVAAGVSSTDAVNFGQLSATNKAVNAAATTAAQGWNLSANGEASPQNIAPGDTAINGSQLHATNQAVQAAAATAGQGWSLSVNGEASPQNIGPGGTVELEQGANVEVTREGNKVTVSTAKDVNFDSMTTGNTVVNNLGIAVGPNVSLGATGLVIVGGPSVTTTGINAGNQVITNVAAGVNATDAVNVGQLTQTSNVSANTWVTGAPTSYVAPSATGVDSTAIGSGASAGGNKSVAVGTNAVASIDNSVALGNGSTTTQAVANTGVTIQGSNYNFAGANPTGVVSVGSAGNERQLQNVAAGQLSATSTDAVNGSQLYATNQAINELGIQASSGINLATNAVGTGVAINSTQSQVRTGGTATLTAGNNMVLTQDGSNVAFAVTQNPTFESVKVGNTTVSNNGVSVQGGPSLTDAGIDAGNHAVVNVAAGVNGTDAVNVNQLNASAAAANAYTDARVATLQNNLNGVARKAYAGVAAAMAMESAPYVAGKTSYAGAVGVYQGQSAVGMTFRRTAENGRWSVSGGVSASAAGAGARVAFTGVWD